MSENQSGFQPFNNAGEAPKVDAYKWGFNLKSIKGANTDITYGWKGSGVFGLSTSIYVSPIASPTIAALTAAAGITAGIGAGIGSDATQTAGNVAFDAIGAAAGVYAIGALAVEVSKSRTLYDAAVVAQQGLFPLNMCSVTNIGLRKSPSDYMMSIPAYMTVEIGAKTDFIYGNKWDFVTGVVNKIVNGETVQCAADKVEWYDANLYKYIQGTETKMEVKSAALKVRPSVPGGKNLTQVEVLNDKSHYADNYVCYNEYNKVVPSKDLTHSAGQDIIQTATRNYSLTAKKIDLDAGDSNITAMAMQELSLSAGTSAFLGVGAGTITLQCGPKKAMVVSAGTTQINNQLSLGMPGIGAVPNVAEALAQYGQQVAALQADMAKAKANIALLTGIAIGLAAK